LGEQALKEGIINASEAELLARAEKGRLQTINVDDFDPQELVASHGAR
jgi:acyl-CoA dehydrogenase